MTSAVQATIRWAEFYRSCGYNPLPSNAACKAPALPFYAEFWDRPFGAAAFEVSATANIQLMCGVRWNLAVVDCDGRLGREVLMNLILANGGWEPTWQVRTPGGGRHLYFRPRPGAQKVETGRLWGLWDTAGGREGKGGWVAHQGIEVLGERHLVTAPPSCRKDGSYRWVPGRSPREIAEPAVLPEWLDTMSRLAGLAPREAGGCSSGPLRKPGGASDLGASPERRGRRSDRRYRREDVIAAIHARGPTEMVQVAESFGLKIASQGSNAAGWLRCHAVSKPGVPGREAGDENPSASFHAATGCYLEHYPGFGPAWSLFDLAAYLRGGDWRDHCNELGERYGVAPMASPKG